MAGDIFYERQEEIMSGLNNALVRGETLDFARITFLNAGYDPQVVNAAANKLHSGQGASVQQVQNVKVAKMSSKMPAKLPLRAQKAKPVASANNMMRKPKVVMGIPYWVVIFMILIAAGIVVGAGVFGLYWNQLFT